MTAIPKAVTTFARHKMKIKGKTGHSRGSFTMDYDISSKELCVRLKKLAEEYSDIIDNYVNNKDCIFIRFKDYRLDNGKIDDYYRSLYFEKATAKLYCPFIVSVFAPTYYKQV